MSEPDRHSLQQRLHQDFQGITQKLTDMKEEIARATSGDSPGTRQFAADLQNEMDLWQAALPARTPRAPPPRPPPAPSTSTNDNAPNPNANGGKKPPSKGKPRQTASEKEEEAIRTRLAAIHAEAAKPPITIDEHTEFLKERSSQTGPGAMDAALGRALRGYQLAGNNQQESGKLWRQGFEDYFSNHIDNIAAVVAESEPPPADKNDRYAWLVKADKHIARQQRTARTNNTIDRTHLALTSIEFSVAWERQNNPEKNDAFTALFVDQPQHQQRFKDMDLKEASAVVKSEFKDEFEKWKTEYRRVELTPRNKLAEVYMLTGIHVVLDPFWSLENLGEGKSTHGWTKILSQLRLKPPVDAANVPLPVALYRGNRAATLGVLNAVHPALCNFALAVSHRTQSQAALDREKARKEDVMEVV